MQGLRLVYFWVCTLKKQMVDHGYALQLTSKKNGVLYYFGMLYLSQNKLRKQKTWLVYILGMHLKMPKWYMLGTSWF